jgi:hypothetical protein
MGILGLVTSQTIQPRPNRAAIRTLRFRLQAQTAELATCTTAAMVLCVEQAIADTHRQLRDAGAAS